MNQSSSSAPSISHSNPSTICSFCGGKAPGCPAAKSESDVTRIAPSGLPVYAITKGSVNGSHFEMARGWDGTVPELLADVIEVLSRGKLYRATWACPVNGDGYRYWRQELVNAAGEVRGTVRRDDLGSEEL